MGVSTGAGQGLRSHERPRDYSGPSANLVIGGALLIVTGFGIRAVALAAHADRAKERREKLGRFAP